MRRRERQTAEAAFPALVAPGSSATAGPAGTRANRGRAELGGKVLRLSDMANNKVRVTTSAKKKKKSAGTGAAAKVEAEEEVDDGEDEVDDIMSDPDDDGALSRSGESSVDGGDRWKAHGGERLVYIHPDDPGENGN
jgi:hypothetical protein